MSILLSYCLRHKTTQKRPRRPKKGSFDPNQATNSSSISTNEATREIPKEPDEGSTSIHS